MNENRFYYANRLEKVDDLDIGSTLVLSNGNQIGKTPGQVIDHNHFIGEEWSSTKKEDGHLKVNII